MGAQHQVLEGKSSSAELLFNQLSSHYEEEYGCRDDNGTISTTYLSKVIKVADKYSKRTENKIKAEIETMDDKYFPQKWETVALDLGVIGYQPQSPVYEESNERTTREKGVTTLKEFAVFASDNHHAKASKQYRYQYRYNTLTEAKKKAKELSLKMRTSYMVIQERSNGEYIHKGTFNLEDSGAEAKSQRTSKTKVYTPIHKYILCAYANE